ncbi:MAG: gamma carbonic anhydrase family protein [Dehalococcoidia bacterium]|jgi:carbonic anhydrase/acetyltransferase-like protein (isoleucine patch superfamily)
MIRSFKGKTPQVHPTAFVSEAAYVVGDVEIGENSSIWPGAVVRGDFGRIKIGKNTSVEDNCVIHTPDGITIGDNVIIGHAATVHCRSIGDDSLIGISAVLLQHADVGRSCLVAAGALVPPDMKIPDRSLAIGSPARIKEQLSDEMLAVIRLGADAYVDMAQDYKRAGYV